MEIDIQTLNDLIDSKLVMVADKINQNVKGIFFMNGPKFDLHSER